MPEAPRDRASFLRPSAPFLRALAARGHDPQAFRRRGLWVWALLGMLLLTLLALLPLDIPETAPWVLRVDNLLALLFLVASIGLWLGMGARAFVVAAVVALVLYAVTASVSVGFSIRDVESLAVLVAFLVFALSGFNLVFVLEEMVHDTHRVLRPRAGLLAASMVTLSGLLALGLPYLTSRGGPNFHVLWLASVLAFAALSAFAIGQATGVVARRVSGTILRELHLFAIGILAAAALVDGVTLLRSAAAFVPSLIAMASLLGTWVYVTYTTLQRTHFLLKGDDPRPWVAILLGACFAILGHAESLYATQGVTAVEDLLSRRIAFLAWGVWIGIGLYIVRGVWAGLAWLRASSAKPNRLTDNAASLAAGLMATEDTLERAAYALFRGLDEVLPGPHHPPNRPTLGWQRELGVRLEGEAVEPEIVELRDVAEGAD